MNVWMYEQQLDKIEKAAVYMSVYDVQFWHEAGYEGVLFSLGSFFPGWKRFMKGMSTISSYVVLW